MSDHTPMPGPLSPVDKAALRELRIALGVSAENVSELGEAAARATVTVQEWTYSESLARLILDPREFDDCRAAAAEIFGEDTAECSFVEVEMTEEELEKLPEYEG